MSSSRGAGVGSFMQGLMQGVDFAQDVQYKRKRKKALEYSLSQMDRDEQAAQANASDVTDEERAFYGDGVTEAAPTEFDVDPFLFRLTDWATKRFGKKKRGALPASAPIDQNAMMGAPAPMPAAEESATPYALEDAPQAYADGGTIDPEEAKKRAAQNRERNPGRVERATETVEGADRTMKRTKALGDAASAAPRKTGFIRGALGGGAAMAGIGGAVKGLQTPTEDYYTRLGLDPRDAGLSFWKDAGVRTLGVLSDVGDTALGMVGIDQRSRFADQQAAEPAPEAAPLRQVMPDMGGALSVTAGGRSGGVSSRPAPAAPRSPQPGDAVDLSNLDIDSSELPNLNVNDWKRVRAQALRTARLRGMPQAEALDQADKVVTGIQIRGFTNYASQAAALMQSGNLKGAARSLRAAYQYFPDGNDVKIGIQNGHLIGVGIDEATGKPFEKGTRVITPEFLAGAIQNFANPTAFLSWTKDWRDEAFKRRQYEEVTKPLAQAQGQALSTNSEASMLRAENYALRAGQTGGLKQSDMRGAQQFFAKRLELLGVSDAAQADQLGAVMAQIKARYPQTPEMQIINDVMRAAQAGTLDQVISRLQGASPQASMVAVPQATPEGWDDPALDGMTDEEKRWALTPAQ